MNAEQLLAKTIAAALARHAYWPAARKCSCGEPYSGRMPRYGLMLDWHHAHVAGIIAARLLAGALPPKEFLASTGKDATGRETLTPNNLPHAAAPFRSAGVEAPEGDGEKESRTERGGTPVPEGATESAGVPLLAGASRC